MNAIVQFSLATQGLACMASINGFPLLEIDAGEDGMAGMPLNPFLIGKDNSLRIEVSERRDGAWLNGNLGAAAPGEIIELSAPGNLELPPGPAPLFLERSFGSKAAPFRAILDQARPTGASEMTSFALQLRDSFKSRDTQLLARLFAAKVRLYSEGFGVPEQSLAKDIAASLDNFFGADFLFTDRQLSALPFCDGRVWELRRAGGPLLEVSDADGNSSSLKVFAALLPTGPGVVA